MEDIQSLAGAPLSTFIPTMACLLATFRNGTRNYDGYHIFKLQANRDLAFETVKNWFFNEDFDFLSEPSKYGSVDILVPPSLVTSTKSLLSLSNIPYEIPVADLASLLVEQANFAAPRESEMSWTRYHRQETIHDWMKQMANEYPQYVSVRSAGNSTEGRPLLIMKISTDQSEKADKPAIWIDGGIHAREWIGPATVTYMMNEIIKDAATGKEGERHVDDFDWYFDPILNPDGYEYTHTTDRMWRKTRSGPGRPIFGGLLGCCKGTDPNRNWNYQWGGKGTSNNVCSQIYRGPSPASEPEVSNIQDFVFERKDKIKLFLTFHSYSQLILLPWSYDDVRADDHDDLMEMGLAAAATIKKQPYKTQYKVGPTPEVLYAASGGSHDWAKGVAGIKFSYCYELRDTGDNGFQLPPSQILPSGIETFEAVKNMAENVKKYYRNH